MSNKYIYSYTLMIATLIAFVTAIECFEQAPLEPPTDADYEAMQKRLLIAMDGVSGKQFVWNWINLMSENGLVCYPFVGVISDDLCINGKSNIIKAFENMPATYSTSIEQKGFYLSKTVNSTSNSSLTAGVWHYSLSSSYQNDKGQICVVQFGGVVIYRLDPGNYSAIGTWLETPDSNRISRTYPCRLYDDEKEKVEL